MDAAAQVHAAFVPVRRAELGTDGVALSAWSPAIDVCAVVTSDGQLAVHRMNWQQLWAVAPEAPVTALAWRPDGKLLATGHADGALAVWDVETGEPVARHARAHFAPVTALDWSLTPAATARIDRDDDRWCSSGSGGGGRRGANDAAEDAEDDPGGCCCSSFNPAASAATAATYEDRQGRLFPSDGLVLVTAQGGAPQTANSKEDPYAELFRGAPPAAPRGGGGASAAAAAAAAATATWEVVVVAPTPGAGAASSSSCPPLDLLCAADRRGCLSAWVGAGRVQVGDVAGLAPRVAVVVATAAEAREEDEEAPTPPPPPTLVALGTAADQSACVSVAWHPPPPPPADAGDDKTTTAACTAAGLVAAPLALRPLRAARREVRHWARLHWRLKGLLDSATLALQAAAREWASAASNVRKRVLDELAEALAAHSADGDAAPADDADDDDMAAAGDRQSSAFDPRADLMLLLATGSAGPGVHAWLTGALGESGVQRAARGADAALERVHALLLHACLPALERAAFLLGELRGLAAATCPEAAGEAGRGALLGLRPEALAPLEAAAVRAVARAEQVRLGVGRLAAAHRALFTWLLRTARRLESAASEADAASGNDPAAAAAASRPPPEPPAGPDAALADVLLPFLDEGGALEVDPLAPELDARQQHQPQQQQQDQQRAARRWLHGGSSSSSSSSGAEDGGGALGPEAVVDLVLRVLYPPSPPETGAGADGGAAAPPPLSLAGQVAALAEACEESLAAPQSSVSTRLTVGRPVCLAPARCFAPAAAAERQQQQQQQQQQPPRVSIAPAAGGDGACAGGGAAAAGRSNDGDEGDEGGVVICVVVPAAGLAAMRPEMEQREQEGEADGILVVRARPVPATGAGSNSNSNSGGGPAASDPLELCLSAVLVRGDPGARVVDAAPYKGGQLAVLSSPSPSSLPSGRHAAPPPPPAVLALLDLSSVPFAAVGREVAVLSGGGQAPAAAPSTALEACLASGAVVDAADLAAAGCVRAARLGGFSAAVAPLAVSRARGLALVLSDMQRLAVLDVDADEEGVGDDEGAEEE